jgi:hypothetical protein
MPNGNGKMLGRVVTVLSSLLVFGIIGSIIMYRELGIAQDNIENIEEKQEIMEEAVRELPVIQNDVEHIKDAVERIEQAVGKIAESSHEHNPR